MGGCYSTNERRRDRKKEKQDTAETSTKINEVNPNINENNTHEFNTNDINEKNNNNNNHVNNNLKENINNSDINFYLICPNCTERSPHIEKLYYDEKYKDFSVKYTCICFLDVNEPKDAKFMDILTNKEPSNLCIIHPGNKLINFCKDCHKAICNICKSEEHNCHIFEDNINNNISKEDADNMLKIIKQKEEQFNLEINQNEEKIENGIDNMIQKLNKERQNYKKQLENYKDNNQKTFDFLKNLYGRYINNFDNKNNNLNQTNPINQDNNINHDIMLNNHINKFTIDNNIPKLNSNLDEIINNYNDEQKELKLKYDYGFPNINKNSILLNPGNNEEERNNLRNNYQNQVKEFECVKTFEGHSEKIVSLIELSSGQIVSGSYDYTIRIWNANTLKTEKIINEDGRVFSLLEFEKGKLLAGTSNNVINLWDLDLDISNDKSVFSFKGHELWVNCLVKIDDNHFASASNDSKIKIWNYYKRIFVKNLNGHTDCILSLILLRNNYLCSGSADLTIKIWDWKNEKCEETLTGHEKWVKSVFELDNGIILSGSDDKTIKIWKNYEPILTLEAHQHAVRTFCQINKKYFASGSFDYTIKIWEIKTWKCVQTLLGHGSNIICIISLKSQNDSYYKKNSIASCSNDKTIKIWEGNL